MSQRPSRIIAFFDDFHSKRGSFVKKTHFLLFTLEGAGKKVKDTHF
jgi:hypothetical protein